MRVIKDYNSNLIIIHSGPKIQIVNVHKKNLELWNKINSNKWIFLCV